MVDAGVCADAILPRYRKCGSLIRLIPRTSYIPTQCIAHFAFRTYRIHHGDTMLSIILGKACLLADDGAISDTVIINQLNRT